MQNLKLKKYLFIYGGIKEQKSLEPNLLYCAKDTLDLCMIILTAGTIESFFKNNLRCFINCLFWQGVCYIGQQRIESSLRHCAQNKMI